MVKPAPPPLAAVAVVPARAPAAAGIASVVPGRCIHFGGLGKWISGILKFSAIHLINALMVLQALPASWSMRLKASAMALTAVWMGPSANSARFQWLVTNR